MCRAKSDGHPLCLSNGDHTCSRDDRLELQVLETGKTLYEIHYSDHPPFRILKIGMTLVKLIKILFLSFMLVVVGRLGCTLSLQ